MRILALISDYPSPPTDGVRVRNYYLWPALQALGVEVKALGLATPPGDGGEAGAGAPGIASEFYRRDRQTWPARAWNAARYSYHQWPRSRALAARVDAVAAQWQPHVIHAETLRMGYYLPCARGRQAAAIQSLTLHNVESELQRKMGSSPVKFGRGVVNRLHQGALRRYEKKLARLADLVFAYSALDLERYRALYPGARWALTQNGANARGIRPAPQVREAKLLFIGSLAWQPNRQGLLWLVEQVLPRLPGVALSVAGGGAGDELRRRLEAAGVAYLGRPADLTPIYAAHAVCVAPLFAGGGTRTKILEACAHERMVVSTRLGAEGLELSPGNEGVVLAEDAESFARALKHWLAEIERRAELARRGREAVLQRYDWAVAAAGLLHQWQALVESRVRA